MIIKKGKVLQNRLLDEVAVQHSEATVIEKTQRAYKEVLLCREKHEILVDGGAISVDHWTNFKLYVDKTIDQVLKMNEITEYTWTEPLTEIS